VTLGAGEERSLADAITAAIGKQVRTPLALPQFSSTVLAEQYVTLYRSLIAAPSPVQSKGSAQRFNTVSQNGGLL